MTNHQRSHWEAAANAMELQIEGEHPIALEAAAGPRALGPTMAG